MNRREFLRVAGGAAGAVLAGGSGWAFADAPAARKPNIIILLADDLGYGETGFQGSKDIPTPNIDSIAAAGVRFTDGYVSCPVCAPTRAGLMSGRYQQRFGFEHNPGPEEAAPENFGLPLAEKTIAERLKALGYATGMVGKWHLGYRPDFTPVKRGFDEFFGFHGGAHEYIPRGPALRGSIMRGDKPIREEEYLTDAFGREAAAFVRKHKDHPFFLYLPFNAVHAPLDACARHLEKFAAIKDEKRRTFATMMTAMDDAIGGVLKALREGGIEEDTLIFFLADNGGPTLQTSSRNDPLRGFKGQVFEGGIRVPFAAQWKKRLTAGRVVREPVISLDILPTALAAAGETGVESRLDGVSLLPLLTGEAKNPPHEALFWRFGEQRAVRAGDWKLASGGGAPELYDLAADISEKNNLVEKRPDKLKELQETYEKWNASNIPPAWGRQNTRPKRRAAAGKQKRNK